MVRRMRATALTSCWAVLALLSIPAGPARADPNCMARILADVPAEEAPEQVKSKQSGMFGPITQVKVERQSGKMFYCAASSYCYGSNAFRIMTSCRLKLDKASSGGNFFIYSAR